MPDLREHARAWLGARRTAVVVEVVEARGSAPREAGTRMLVDATGALGTIGGGHLELKAIAEARALLAELATPAGEGRCGHALVRSRHYPLGPALGQCCGGAVTLSFSPLDAASLDAWPEARSRFHLQLYGAGHVGRAIARALAPIQATVDWIDEREDEFPRALHESPDGQPVVPWPAHIRRISVDGVEAEVADAPPGAFYLVLTHRHDLDLRITEAILRRGDFAFLGLIGSKTKRRQFIRRFEARGIPQATIARMTCPIGLPGIEGKEPETIAAAVVAQLLMVSSPPASAVDASRRHVACCDRAATDTEAARHVEDRAKGVDAPVVAEGHGDE